MAGIENIVAGAYYALVAVFAISGVAFWTVTRERSYAIFAAHAFAIGALSLTFPPIAPAANAVEPWHITTRMMAEGMVIATVGLLIANFLLPGAPRWLRLPIKSIFALGLVASAASVWFYFNTDALALYGMLALVALSFMILAIATCLIRRSTDAVFLAIALGPLIAVGTVAATMEAMEWGSMPLYAEGILLSFMFELIFVASVLSFRFKAAMQQRDKAVADAIQAWHESETDPLTGIANRRAFENLLESKQGTEFEAIALLDCDHFKKINDTYGHGVGDEVLRSIAIAVSQIDGKAMRIGGEEFGLFLRSPDWEDELNTLRIAIQHQIRSDIPQIEWPVTVSIGAVSVSADVRTEMSLMLADDALYSAKSAGRNRLEVYFGKPSDEAPAVLCKVA